MTVADPAGYARARRDYLADMTSRGYSDREIGDALGVHPRTVQTWRTAAGIASGLEQVPPARLDPEERRRRNRAACARYVDRVTRETAAVAAHAFDRWTPADDAVVMQLDGVSAAYALGRTYSAVRARKSVLNARSRPTPS